MPGDRPTITKELLRELGDWRTEKEGRTLAESGAVLNWTWDPPFLSGPVRTGGGNVINSRIKLGDRAFDVENLCSCRQARSQGTICPHVLALIFATMNVAAPITNARGTAPVTGAPAKPPATPERTRKACGYVALEDATPENPVLELMILLPVNFVEACRRGELRVIMEASVAGGAFQPFDVISKDVTYAVGEADERVLALGACAGIWMLPVTKLDALIDHPRVWLGKKTPIAVRGLDTRPRLALQLEPTGECRLRLEAANVPGEKLGAWTFDGKTLTRTIVLPAGYVPGEHRLSRQEFVRFYQHELPGLPVTAEFSPEFDQLEFVEKPAPVTITLDGGLTGLTVSVHVPERTDWTPDPEKPFRYWRYTPINVAGEIEAAGFVNHRLTNEQRVGQFLANVLPRWERRWTMEYGPQFAAFLRKCDRIEPEVQVRPAGENWLAVDVNYAGALTPVDVQRMLQKGAAHHRQANGRIALVPSHAVEQFQEVLRDCDPHAGKIHRQFAPFLAEALQDGPMRARWELPGQIREAVPLRLPDFLRSYQRDGVNWLHQLATNGFAGVLADEMGLGKTVQTLCWLAAANCRPALIVCPTSLLANWEAEVQRFTPELKTLVLHGRDRELAEIPGHDVVITSYALLRRDVAEHQKIEWSAVVLDEAQQIKNRFSQIAQAVKLLNAKHRVVLTGTPIENSLGDLWSIFDFLMPGYLGPATEFRDRYEKTNDPAAMQRLRQRLRPFVLRRTKAEVAPELPAKIDQVTWCELTEEQQSVYHSILTQGRRDVSEAAKESQRRMAVLTTLLRLRQACCHLDLLPGEQEWREPSAKLATCLELIDEAVSGGHRVLVFSQFVKLLKLVQAELTVPHCYLDGSTVERAGEIRRFQESEIPVFLISLKAGGTGLNLTAADTVIHLDPWWNPAVEEQATARAHRIGQRQVVTSYKLLARGSVEEKILQLQERKRELFGQLVPGDEALVQHLSLEDLQSLLQ